MHKLITEIEILNNHSTREYKTIDKYAINFSSVTIRSVIGIIFFLQIFSNQNPSTAIICADFTLSGLVKMLSFTFQFQVKSFFINIFGNP